MIKRLGLVTLIVARGPYANLSPVQKFERKLLKKGQPTAMRSFAILYSYRKGIMNITHLSFTA